MSHPVVRFGGEAAKPLMMAAATGAAAAAHTTIATTIATATAAATAAAPFVLPVLALGALAVGAKKLLDDDD
ncbi:hypothetical protein BV378_38130 [Nostoc sp. RF31YmG]|nr:hypothetical protein BV378_38130 [Nostoc sp. RF31YmG]